MTTFLGTPGIGNLRGDEPFPRAARRALQDSQMRRNVGHATRTIRVKRLAAVSECADWEQLRAAGSALKQDVLARLPELLEQLERTGRSMSSSTNAAWSDTCRSSGEIRACRAAIRRHVMGPDPPRRCRRGGRAVNR